jgi:hypothetical protein
VLSELSLLAWRARARRREVLRNEIAGERAVESEKELDYASLAAYPSVPED